MISIVSRFPRRPNGAYGVVVHGQLRLAFDRRQKSRQRAVLVSGEEVAIELPRGQVLRGGDWVVASDGRVIEIVAEPEQVIHIECDGAQELARAAYHLGNRHTPTQVGRGWLRIQADDVLAAMLRGLGATVTALSAPFEPEAGAYAAGHHAHSSEAKHAGVIHDFVARHGDGPKA